MDPFVELLDFNRRYHCGWQGSVQQFQHMVAGLVLCWCWGLKGLLPTTEPLVHRVRVSPFYRDNLGSAVGGEVGVPLRHW
jgi:hypothetical protein